MDSSNVSTDFIYFWFRSGFLVFAAGLHQFYQFGYSKSNQAKWKEIGIRKVNVPKEASLIRQFLTESFLINGIRNVSSGLGMVYLIFAIGLMRNRRS